MTLRGPDVVLSIPILMYRFLIVAAAAVPFGFFVIWFSPLLTSSSQTSAVSSAASSDLSTRNLFSRFVFGRFEFLVFGVDLCFSSS